MSEDGLYGDGLYGSDYYSARVVDAPAGPALAAASSLAEFGRVIHVSAVSAINAASNMVAQSAARIRTAHAAIVAFATAVWAGIKFWEPPAPGSASWLPPSTDPAIWTPVTAGSASWLPPSAPTAAWTIAEPGTPPTWTPK